MDFTEYDKELAVLRMRAIEQLKAALDDTAGRPRSAEEQEKIDRIDARIDELDKEIQANSLRARRERESAQLRENDLQLFGEAHVAKREQRDNLRLRDWLANGCQGAFEANVALAAQERHLLRSGASAAEIRNVIQPDAGSGTLIVPTTLDRALWEYLEATVAALRMPTSKVPTSTGEPLQLPTLTAHAIGTQVATTNTAIAGTDPAFGRVNLNAYRYGQVIHVANDSIRDTAFPLEQWVGRDIARGIGRVVDADLIVGTGSSEPTGMMVLAGAGTNTPIKTGGTIITPTVEKFIDLVYSVNDGARSTGAAAFLVKDSTAGTMRKLRDGAGGTVGAFLWQPSLTNGVIGGQPDAFLGYPVYTDPNVAAQGSDATTVAFGDWSEYAVRTVGNVMLESTTALKFAEDQTSFRGKWSVGGNHTQVSHVNVIQQNA